MRIHLGCGPNILPGWMNVDIKEYPGVDVVRDVRRGLPFENASFIFGEHFLEHFSLEEAMMLLRECRRVLADDGVLRLSTPNLDWVWITSYPSRWKEQSATTAKIDAQAWRHDEAAARDCLALNRAFRAWGHRFLWNAGMLEEAARRAGFRHVEWYEYGSSKHAELAGLERHERYEDSPELPHILIMEASGKSDPRASTSIEESIVEYQRDVGVD